jgi:hypothetical protein
MKIRIEKYIMGIALLLLAACAKQPVEPAGPVPQGEGTTIHYRAKVSEDTATRATTDGFNQYIFEAGDILYLEGTKMHGSLTLQSGAGESTALFEGDLVCDEGYFPAEGEDLSATLVSETAVNCGFYAFDANGKLQGPNYPADQFAATFADAVSKYSVFTVNGKYGDASFILSQRSSFLVFAIRCDKGKVHVGDNVQVSLYNSGTPIRSASVQAADLGAYTRLSFVTALLGGTSLSGASLSVKWGTGTEDHKEFTDITDASLSANKYYNITRDAVVPYAGFRIRATQDGTTITFRFNYKDGGTEISKENGADGTWQHYNVSGGTGKNITLNKDEELCVRATRTSYQNVLDDYNGSNKWYTIQGNPLMTADKKVYIAGNILSLLKDGVLTEFAFAGAFAKTSDTNTIDIDPDDPLVLPATTLTMCCYTRMFLNCKSLTAAPALPATTLAEFCYYNMFRGCTNLTDLSVFSETKLPASVLVPNCYRELFRDCAKLTAVPKDLLPVTTLAERCYQQMFQGCKAITQVPDLPAPELVLSCYSEMFNGCEALKNITCLATTGINQNSSTNAWVNKVGGNGTFTKKNGVSWPTGGTNGIPNNWTVVGVD